MKSFLESAKELGVRVRLPYMKAGKIIEPPPRIPTKKVKYKVNIFDRAKVKVSDVWGWIDGKKLIIGGLAVIAGETVLTGGLALLAQGIGYAFTGVGAGHGIKKLVNGEGKVSWEIIFKTIIEWIGEIINHFRKEN